ncbi:MAG: 4Fe-4S binding protein [Bacteroidota bacterium]
MNKTTYRILQVAFLVVLVVLIKVLNETSGEQHVEETDHNLEYVKDHFGREIDVRSDSVGQVCTVLKSGDHAGYVLYSSELENQTKGFASALDFAVLLDEDMRIIKIELLSHGDETPSYINWLKRDGFFKQWNGMTPEEVLNKEPQIITGATMSCNAVSKDMNQLMHCLSDYKEVKRKTQTGRLLKNLAAFAFLLFAVLHFFFRKKLAKTRWILLVASIVILGIWGGYFISMALLYGWLMKGMVLDMQLVLFVIFAVSVGLPLITGRSFYCTYVCPFGALQELAGKLNNNKTALPKRWKTFFRWFRISVFFALLILLLAGISLPLSDMEPFSVFQIQAASLAVIILAGLMLVLSVFTAKPWCRYACPTGVFFELFRKPVLNNKK